MTHYLNIHPDNPQPRLLEQAAKMLREGQILALPTDACYVLACHLGDKDALDRLRLMKGVDDRHHLTLMCRDLSEIANYARVDNSQYRLLKSCLPGPYTFILEGSKELPRRVMHSKRKTIGLRVPDHRVIQLLLAELGEPILTTTLQLPGDDLPMQVAWEIQERLDEQVGAVVDAGDGGIEPTTVVDLTDSAPQLIRQGCGSLTPLGL